MDDWCETIVLLKYHIPNNPKDAGQLGVHLISNLCEITRFTENGFCRSIRSYKNDRKLFFVIFATIINSRVALNLLLKPNHHHTFLCNGFVRFCNITVKMNLSLQKYWTKFVDFVTSNLKILYVLCDRLAPVHVTIAVCRALISAGLFKILWIYKCH